MMEGQRMEREVIKIYNDIVIVCCKNKNAGVNFFSDNPLVLQ